MLDKQKNPKDEKRVELTVLTSLVLVVTESTVKSRQLSKLVPLELVLTLGDGCGLRNPR